MFEQKSEDRQFDPVPYINIRQYCKRNIATSNNSDI